jgi:SAM-dependent methyltransferase
VVANSNQEQAAEWAGAHGDYWARHAAQFEACTAAHRRRLIRAMDVRPDSHVLDVGCGTGRVTLEVARIASAGSALGIDLSGQMIEVARTAAAAEGLDNAKFEQADAQIHQFRQARFDIVVANTAAMFFGDKHAAFGNLTRAMRPGGTLGLTTWQPPAANPWFVAFTTALAAGRQLPAPPPDGPHPFSMAEPGRVRPVLEGAGLVDVTFEPLEEPMYFGPDAHAAFEFMLGQFGWLLDGIGPAEQERAKEALLATLREHTTDEGVRYESRAWLITARRSA